MKVNSLSNTAHPSLKLYTLIMSSDGIFWAVSFLSTQNIELDYALAKFFPNFDKDTDHAEMDCVPFRNVSELVLDFYSK